MYAKTFVVENTNEAMYPVYSWMAEAGILADSRNGQVLRAPCPVVITYMCPTQKVNFCPIRDANPFFHLLESIWMVAGSNKLKPLAELLPSFADFSDDGQVLNAAYGHRARHHFGFDQLMVAGTTLRMNPESRQAIVQLWEPFDMAKETKDKACNTQLMFAVSPLNQTLEMTVINRSNDAIWGGVSGANVVHLAYLFEVVAFIAGREPGCMHVFSNNLHIYTDNPKASPLLDKYRNYDPRSETYHMDKLTWEPILQGLDSPSALQLESQLILRWIADFDEQILTTWTNRFIGLTVIPMMKAALAHKDRLKATAFKHAHEVRDGAWRKAAIEWLSRRYDQ